MDQKQNDTDNWDQMSYDEKNRVLYEKQKELLDTFMSHGAISKEQHDKSLADLTERMHLSE